MGSARLTGQLNREHPRRQGLVEEARLEGFRDCEELIIAMLEEQAGRAAGDETPGQFAARFALNSAALAIRMGQHKREAGHG